MSITNQPNRIMPNNKLEEHIVKFLAENNTCVLATSYEDTPRATPIEYRSKGTTLYFACEPGIKLRNITKNPNVSVGIYLPYKGFDSVKGAQITGKAKILTRNTAEFNTGLEAYQWEKTAKEFNLSEFPKSLQLLRVDISKVELIDVTLKEKGYSSRQVLTLKPPGTESEA